MQVSLLLFMPDWTQLPEQQRQHFDIKVFYRFIIGEGKKPCFTFKGFKLTLSKSRKQGSQHGFSTVLRDTQHHINSAGCEPRDLYFRDRSHGITASLTAVKLHGGTGSRPA